MALGHSFRLFFLQQKEESWTAGQSTRVDDAERIDFNHEPRIICPDFLGWGAHGATSIPDSSLDLQSKCGNNLKMVPRVCERVQTCAIMYVCMGCARLWAYVSANTYASVDVRHRWLAGLTL